MKTIQRMMVLMLLIASFATSATLQTAGVYAPNRHINVQIHHQATDNQNWIGIYHKESSNAWSNVITWQWTKGKSSVDMGGLPKGSYEARLFYNNSFNLEASSAFSVTDNRSSIDTIEAKYAPNDTVAITINGELSGDKDWAGIYPVGASNDWGNVIAWNWVGNGTTQLTQNKKPMPSGKYEVRLFFHNSFKLETSSNFEVGDNKPSMHTTESEYKPNDRVAITINGELSGDRDWAGIYPVGASNDWGNVIAWNWVGNGTTQLTQNKKSMPSGKYEVRLFFHNSYHMESSVDFGVNDIKPASIIGARPVAATPLEKGKLFASPNGSGDSCSKNNPCSIRKAITKLSTDNNVLFLRDGIYHIDRVMAISSYKRGTANKPLIIESYPQEKAILTGDATVDKIKNGEVKPYDGFWIGGGQGLRYIKLRNLEIKNMGGRGVVIMRTKGITIEGCHIHDNHLSGIHLYQSSNNIIVDNHLYKNSDIGLFGKIGGGHYDGGGNADGVNIDYTAQSKNNNISHNTVYNNSDDGIDLIGGINTVANYNLVYQNKGIAGEDSVNAGPGNGIGIKACGRNARGTHLEHNIAFGNNGNGFECNVNNGEGVIFQYNTSYNNGNYGFEISTGNSVAKLLKNISSKNNNSENNINGVHTDNSWNRGGEVRFMSIDPHSANFLKPVKGSGFDNIGAYAN